MRRAYTVAEIERRGLGIVNQDLLFGPVPIMQHHRPVYVLMSAEQFAALAGERASAEVTMVKELLESVVSGALTPETAQQALDELQTAMPEPGMPDLTELGGVFFWPALPSDSPATIHQLKITLEGIRPPIWRRVQVVSDTNLRRLHDIIQVAMGWQQSHLYEFTIGRTAVGEPESSYDEIPCAADFTLRQVAPDLKAKLSYLYDFGDSWNHKIVVETIMPPEEGVTYPRCVTGKRAGPPEDSGGVWGYVDLLNTLADPKDPEHEDMVEWIGTDRYDPMFIDLAAINATLTNLGPGPWEFPDDGSL